MQLELKTQNTEKVRAALARISGAQAQAAYAQAIEDTAKQAARAIRAEMAKTFDRPTRYILNSVQVKIHPQKLSASVLPSYHGGQSVDPQQILQAQEYGGQRRAKRAESVLQQVGLLPQGWVTVPGQGARIDSNGNMSAGQIMQILSQLRAATTAGYTRNMAFGERGAKAQERAGGRFFVIPPGGRTQPGVYQREFMGRGITPVLIFVKSASYRPRLGMERIAEQADLQAYFEKRIRYRIYQAAEGEGA